MDSMTASLFRSSIRFFHGVWRLHGGTPNWLNRWFPIENGRGVGLGNSNLFSCFSFCFCLPHAYSIGSSSLFKNAWLVCNQLLMLCWRKKKLVSRSSVPSASLLTETRRHTTRKVRKFPPLLIKKLKRKEPSQNSCCTGEVVKALYLYI